MLPVKDIITSQETDKYSKIQTTKSKGKKEKKKKLPPTGGNTQGFLLNTLKCHKLYYCSRCRVTVHLEQEHK